MFECGMRAGELSSLKFSDIHNTVLKDGTIKHYISIQRTEIKVRDENGKWAKIVSDYPKSDAGLRDIIIPDKAVNTVKAIRRLNPFGTYMFEEKGERIKEQAFNRKLHKICKALDINYRSTHKVRRAYSVALYDNCVSDTVITEMMGHTSIETTRKYYIYSNKTDRTKIEQVNNAINY